MTQQLLFFGLGDETVLFPPEDTSTALTGTGVGLDTPLVPVGAVTAFKMDIAGVSSS